MKIDTNMATIPGVSKRPTSRFYQYCIVIPQDHQPAYEGRKTIRQSLRTADLREANLRGTQELARRLEEFNTKRLTLSPQRLDTVTPEMAQRVRAGVLRLDDMARESPKVQSALNELHPVATRSALTLTPPKPVTPSHLKDSLSGLSEGEATALAALNDIMSANTGVNLALRNLRSTLPLVVEESLKLGLAFDSPRTGRKRGPSSYP
jgi:hypothetical protein